MTSDARPWFPLLVDDFLGDEAVKLMDNRAVGCFVRLLCHQWRHRTVPADCQALAKICNEKPKAMERVWSQIGPQFHHPDPKHPHRHPGRLINPKLERVRRQQDTGSRALRGAWQPTGKTVAKRWQKSGLKPEPDIKKDSNPDDEPLYDAQGRPSAALQALALETFPGRQSRGKR